MQHTNYTDSDEWKKSIEKVLEKASMENDADYVIPYSQVAKAFPTATRHPSAFHHSLIDSENLDAWASKRGWRVNLAHEILSSDSNSLPLVRFCKQ